MDRLEFCRQNLKNLKFEELADVYAYLSYEYADGEYVLENDMKSIDGILEVMEDCGLSNEDWREASCNGDYCWEDRYIEICPKGISSFNHISSILTFVDKKMNGEAMSMIENYLEESGIIRKRYVVIHDEENEEFHLHKLCGDGNPSNRREIVGCEDLHEIFTLSKNLGIEKKDIVDLLKISEVKQYS